jgi:hypothetical protein
VPDEIRGEERPCESGASPQARAPSARRRGGEAGIWGAYVALFALSVPWYFPAGSGEPLVLGLPLWCFVSLACYAGVAVLTAWRLDVLWAAPPAEGSRVRER